MSLAETARKAALEEVRKERESRAKDLIKQKMKSLENARTIVANLERELTDLLASIDQGNF